MHASLPASPAAARTRDVADLQRRLRDTGRYETPPEVRPARPARAGLRTSWRYYLGALFFRCVVRGAREARRGRFDRAAWARQAFSLWRDTEAFGGMVTCEGFEALAGGGPFVYVSNHMSLIETIVLPAALLAFSPLTIVVKDSLLRYPVFGGPVRAVAPIAVTRRNARQDLATVLQEGARRLAEGCSVLLFPQGTRALVFDPRQFNSLGARLAQRAGCRLAPIALQTDFAPPGRWLRDCGPVDPSRPVRFAVGAPLAPGDVRSVHQAALAFITRQLLAWGLPVAAADGPEAP